MQNKKIVLFGDSIVFRMQTVLNKSFKSIIVRKNINIKLKGKSGNEVVKLTT